MVNVYIYCRVSSKEQSNLSTGHISLEVQEINCREYADKQGWTVKKVVTEVSSAREMGKLKNLMALIKEIKKTRTEATLMFNNISRFSRNTLEALLLIRDLKKHNISVFSVQEQVNMNTGGGRHTFRIMLSNAEYESDMISERVRQAFAIKRQMGSELGMAPYGYEAVVDGNIRRFVDNAYEQNVVLFVCEAFKCEKTDRELTSLMMDIKQCEDNTPIDFFDENDKKIQKLKPGILSYKEIADLLNDYSVTKRGKEWTSDMVAGIIRKHCPQALNIIKSRNQPKNKVPGNNRPRAMQIDHDQVLRPRAKLPRRSRPTIGKPRRTIQTMKAARRTRSRTMDIGGISILEEMQRAPTRDRPTRSAKRGKNNRGPNKRRKIGDIASSFDNLNLD